MKGIDRLKYHMNISAKLMTAFAATSLLAFVATMYMNSQINFRLSEIEQVYTSNNQLNDISIALGGIQSSMQEYLDTRSSESLQAYYNYDQSYQGLLENLNSDITDDQSDIMEKNIKKMSENYRKLTANAIDAKRARDISRYKIQFDDASKMYQFLHSYIFSLNNVRFEVNSGNYESLAGGLRMLEKATSGLNVVVTLINMLILGFLIRQIIRPLIQLAKTADCVASGDFNVSSLIVYSMDEVGIVTNAFNKMVVSIREYMKQIRESLHRQNEAKERELLMEASLKEAQLKYYQAQIHPHFLFNTLNAGAQVAMMEGADRTSSFILHMSRFFRYSLKNPGSDVSLEEEMNLVENYIYIMNVRFSGEIHYSKEVDCDISDVKIPAMTLQPVVENAIRYGIRDMKGQGKILLKISEIEEHFCIRVIDNGEGIEESRICELREGSLKSSENEDDSNGIGLANVMERIHLYYQEEGLMDIKSEGSGKGTVVEIKVPKRGQ